MAPAPKGKGKAKASSSSTPSRPRLLACGYCHKKKMSCTHEQPRCARCQKDGKECIYAKAKKVRVNETNLGKVKAELRLYKELFQSLPENVKNTFPKGSLEHIQDADMDLEEEEVAEDDNDDASLPDQSSQISHYLHGSRGSADNFYWVARNLSSQPDENSGMDASQGFYGTETLPSRKQSLAEQQLAVELPPIDIARKYFDAQYIYIGTIFAFTDRNDFERQLKSVHLLTKQLYDRQARLAAAKYFMIMAFGKMYHVNHRVSDGNGQLEPDSEEQEQQEQQQQPLTPLRDDPPGFCYFAQAFALLPEMHEEGSILGVETLAYVGYFMQILNLRDAAYLYIGMALRMAISLGLHQEMPETAAAAASHQGQGHGHGPGISLTAAEREHRRRVWWSIYSLDRILSLKSGRPIAILDEDIGVHMPSRLPDEASDHRPVVVLWHYTQLSRILGEITQTIYRRTNPPHTGASLVAAMQAVLSSLTAWEAALPADLRLEPSFGRDNISTYLHYYQCINMATRPLLFHVVQRRLKASALASSLASGDMRLPGQPSDGYPGPLRTSGPPRPSNSATASSPPNEAWMVGLSGKTADVIQKCVWAARNAIEVMSTAARHHLVTTYGYMDSEHAFSAAIVLVLVCAAFPHDPANTNALKQGLELLHGIGKLGNAHVARRYQLLRNLQASLAGAAGPTQAPIEEGENRRGDTIRKAAAAPASGELAGAGPKMIVPISKPAAIGLEEAQDEPKPARLFFDLPMAADMDMVHDFRMTNLPMATDMDMVHDFRMPNTELPLQQLEAEPANFDYVEFGDEMKFPMEMCDFGALPDFTDLDGFHLGLPAL